MSLVAVGLNHRTAPIEIREKLAFSGTDRGPVLNALKSRPSLTEVALLSTCNRTEAYLVDSEESSVATVRELFSQRLGEDVSPYLYVRHDREAASHLFRVTAGLDSMILGEAQIQGQVRDAWEGSREATGAALNRLFQQAQLVGSRVREETGIGRGAASVSSAAVQLAKKIFGSLNGRKAMVLGAGEVAALALECLVNEGVRVSIVANRTYDRAESLAREHGAAAMHYDECWENLSSVDLLVCSTASPHTMVSIDHVAARMRARGDRPLCILDIALPRDVEANVGELDNVFLYDLDDLRAAAAANLDRRQEDIPSAERIISAEVEKYWQWLAGLAAVPVVTEFRSQMDKVREAELAVALRRISGLSAEQAKGLESFSRSLMNKFLHEPSVRLRAAAANGRGLGVVDAARYLFALERESNGSSDGEIDS
ncbi:MAG TPA: glutamyl-tRNA reductase [Gemmatimonadaceae bacterium]|nr:glutamyl-tRNA reductase [Gemmatimonadaceae bacterium]